MVVCKYFLQGECRFGDHCKFEHQIPSHNMGGHLAYENQSRAFQSNQPSNEIDTNTLTAAVRNDMLCIERSGQWLLTCYAPFKEKQIYPGFQDQSFEEVRWGFYEAQRSNTLDQYKHQLQQALSEARMKFKALQNPTKEMIALFRNIYNNNNNSIGVPQTQSNMFVNNAPSPMGNSIFGQNTNTNSRSSSSVFRNENTIPQMNAQSSIFSQQGGNLFNPQQQSGNVFMQTSNSIFGNASKSMFGNQQNQQQYNVAPSHNNQQQFNPAQSQTNAFSDGNKAMFAPQQQQFGNALSNQIFQQQQNQAFMQNNQNAQQPQQMSQSNVILNLAQQPNQNRQSIFGNNSNMNFVGNSPLASGEMNADLYSRIEDLSESDINWFKSNDLDVHKMPENPPTYDMCFN